MTDEDFQSPEVDGRGWMQRCAADCGISEHVVADVDDWIEEHRPKRFQRGISFVLEKICKLLMGFKNPWLGIRMLVYALSMDDLLGGRCPAEIAREADMTKANAIHTLAQIQAELGLPPRSGQRSDQSRKTMSTVRKGQLK